MAMFYKIAIFYLHAVRMRGCGVSREPSREKPSCVKSQLTPPPLPPVCY
jgi:hypothetical protein